MKKVQILLLIVFTSVYGTSCGPAGKLTTTSVVYQSVKTRHAQPTKTSPIPDDARIAVAYQISDMGKLTAVVYNRTSEIMVIDQTMSFFVNSDGSSTSYYDPTIRTTSTTNASSTTSGASVNFGAVASVLGIGGALGQLASGINMGGSGTSGEAVTTTTYVADQPRVSIGPHGNGAMSKVFAVNGLSANSLRGAQYSLPLIKESDSFCRFSVCISYSFDGGQTFEQLTTNFYADSRLSVPVERSGRVNDSLRKLFTIKPDALYEPLWLLSFNDSISAEVSSSADSFMEESKRQTTNYCNGILFDYQ